MLPPGTAGMTPSLALVYDSGSGNGAVGLGWSLPTGAIQVQTDKGLPRYDGTDRYLYQGAELVPLADGFYRLKNEGAFIRARRAGDGWEVNLPSGTQRRFGFEPSSRIEDSGRKFSWLIEEEVDVFGNRIRYTYQKDAGQPYLTSAQYNQRQGAADNLVTFEYEGRPDALADYRPTFKVIVARRLKGIRVFSQGQLLRRYDLTYYPKAPLSLLGWVEEFGSDGATALPPVQFSYTEFTPAASPIHAVTAAPALLPGAEASSSELADIDGDGFPDVFIADERGHRYYRNRLGQSFEDARDMTGPSVILSTTGVDLADMNGDGLVDLVARTGITSSAFRYFADKGDGSWAPSVVFAGNPSFQPEGGQTRWVDLDHDKLPDAFRLNASSATWWRNNGDGSWSKAQGVDLPPGGTTLDFADSRVKIADFNGDGVADLAFVRSGSVLYWPGMGRGRFDQSISLGGAPDVGTGLESRLQVADLNGDGIADLFYVDTDHLDYWLLQPSGSYAAKQSIATPYANASLTTTRTADMNANGSTDIVWLTPTAARDQRVLYFDAQEGVRPNLLRQVNNGLGLIRRLEYTSSGEEFQASVERSEPWRTRLPFPVQVIGQSWTFDSRGGQYATVYEYLDGYYNAENREFRGFGRVRQRDLGEADDPTSVVLHEYDLGIQNEALKGRETSVMTSDGAGVPYVRTDRTFTARIYASGTDGRKVAGADLQRQETTWYEGGQAAALIREEWTFDDYGNPLTDSKWGLVVAGDPRAGNDESLVATSYANDPVNWILGRPVETSVANAAGEVLTRTRRYYDGQEFQGLPLGEMTRGVATREEQWIETVGGVERWIQTSRVSRDDFGNTVAMLSPRGARREVAYDAATHTVPEREQLLLEGGRVLEFKASYLSGHSLVESFTDANGSTTHFAYDALERLVAIIKPGDTPALPTLKYSYNLANPLSSVMTEERPLSGTGEVNKSFSVVDGLGRAIARVRQAEAGRWVVSERKAYSRRGAVLTEWDPYFAQSPEIGSDAPQSLAVRHGYDVLARRLWTVFPDGVRTERHYGALWREDWDGEDLDPSSVHHGTPMRFEEDGLGRTVRAIERLGSTALTTQFGFDAAGRQVSVTNAKGQTTRYFFNGLGHVRYLEHPEAGRLSYERDEEGNVTRFVDAMGQRIERTFDLAGRILSEDNFDAAGADRGHITYHYDQSSPKLSSDGATPIGRLTWVEDLAGEEHFSYDDRGRMNASLRIVDGKDYRLEQAHDNLDRVVGITYPDGMRLDYAYNERGLLAWVGHVIKGIEYDAYGLATRREYTNGVVSTATYDVHERVKALAAADRSGKAIQDLQYGYDKAGTLAAIEDRVRPDGKLSGVRSFLYDDLYRLTQAKSPLGNSNFDYDSVGNLLQKSDVGAYAYPGPGAAQPNAVTSIGGRPIQHNLNGAVTSSWGRTFEYDPKGDLRRVTAAGGSVTEYLYDFEGHRVVKKVTAAGATKKVVYLDKFAEERNGEIVKYVFAGDVRLARVGGGTPRAVEVAAAFIRRLDGVAGVLAAAALAVGAALMGSAGLARRRLGRRVVAGGLALLMACSGGGGGTNDAALAGTVFYVSDHLGSAELLTDSAGNLVGESSYDAWGAQIAAADEPYGFTGKEWDAEAGLMYFGARYYDPKIGQFLTVDPAALNAPEGSVEDPQALNPYAYARNTPTSLRDRNGQLPHIVIGALVGAVVGTGVYLIKGAITGESYTARGVLAAAAGGAVTGAVAVGTGGASLVEQGIASSVSGGIVERAVATGNPDAAFDQKAIARDAALGALVGKALSIAAPLARKVVGAVKGRMGAAAEEVAEACSGGRCAGPSCFVAGTPVLLASSELVPIEQIVEGDEVLAPASLEAPGELSRHRVVGTSRRLAAEVLDITVVGAAGRGEMLTATAQHPFAVKRVGHAEWVNAGDLRVGDELVGGREGGRVARTAMRVRPTEVFNLEVDDAHAYLVGDAWVVVHNGAECGPRGSTAAAAARKTVDPATIRFSQDSIGKAFKSGTALKEAVEGLRPGKVDPASFPPIRVFERGGKTFTLDNRRLWIFQQAKKPIQTVAATSEEIAAESWKITTTNEGVSVRVRGE